MPTPPYKRRQWVRCTVSATISSCSTAVAAAEPELVARHLTQTGLDEPAIEWWGRAGDQACAARRSRRPPSLAKLYRAANRDADAHAVLAPAVEGFPPTQQFV